MIGAPCVWVASEEETTESPTSRWQRLHSCRWWSTTPSSPERSTTIGSERLRLEKHRWEGRCSCGPARPPQDEWIDPVSVTVPVSRRCRRRRRICIGIESASESRSLPEGTWHASAVVAASDHQKEKKKNWAHVQPPPVSCLESDGFVHQVAASKT